MSTNTEQEYIPNKIPLRTRIVLICSSLGFLISGTIEIINNKIKIPIGLGKQLTAHDTSALLLYASILCAVLVMISVVVDHFDTRNNEESYSRFATFFLVLGALLLVIALANREDYVIEKYDGQSRHNLPNFLKAYIN